MTESRQSPEEDQRRLERRRMVELLARIGIRDSRVLEAMELVPRHQFVPRQMVGAAYDNSSLPIGCRQTISQPYVVALMTTLLRLQENDRVLEIGTGSGYQAAILSLLAKEVYTVERIPELYRESRDRLGTLGYDNVTALSHDGSLGLREQAPFHAILVTAASPNVPAVLLDQLAEGGRLVIPVGKRSVQNLKRLTRHGSVFDVEEFDAVRFVPLLGQKGWK